MEPRREELDGNTPRKKRRLQFSLRTLLLLMGLAALVLSLIAARISAVRKLRDAVAALEHGEAAVTVVYSFQIDNDKGRMIAGAQPPGPKWLRQMAGDDVFLSVGDIAGLRVMGEEFNDESIEAIVETVPHLEWLTLQGTSVSDSGLTRLGTLKHLRSLWLDGCEGVTERGVRGIPNLPHVWALAVENCRLGNAMLEDAESWRQLELLSLAGSRVDDGVVDYLRLLHLRQLDLSRTHLSADGLRRLAELKTLTHLMLKQTDSTDDNVVAALTELDRLEYVNLDGTTITDGALENLGRLAHLAELHIRETKVTRDGVRAFQETHPDCDVWGDY